MGAYISMFMYGVFASVTVAGPERFTRYIYNLNNSTTPSGGLLSKEYYIPLEIQAYSC